MTLFLRRFIGTLVLDASAYEDIEADRHAGMQSVLVVLAVCLAGGMAAIGLGWAGPAGFVTGAVMVLGAWLVWVAIINTVGTVVLSEPQTHTDVRELLRVLGFAAAPGVFLALAVLRPAAPLVFAVVAVWMITAAVLGVRQALDYRSTARAAVVCAIGWLLSFGIIAGFALLLSRPVS
jgi:hypothetical protein